jgi:hypothetical protein
VTGTATITVSEGTPDPTVLMGTVLDENQAGVPGMVVRVSPQGATVSTDEAGDYFADLTHTGGRHVLRVRTGGGGHHLPLPRTATT